MHYPTTPPTHSPHNPPTPPHPHPAHHITTTTINATYMAHHDQSQPQPFNNEKKGGNDGDKNRGGAQMCAFGAFGPLGMLFLMFSCLFTNLPAHRVNQCTMHLICFWGPPQWPLPTCSFPNDAFVSFGNKVCFFFSFLFFIFFLFGDVLPTHHHSRPHACSQTTHFVSLATRYFFFFWLTCSHHHSRPCTCSQTTKIYCLATRYVFFFAFFLLMCCQLTTIPDHTLLFQTMYLFPNDQNMLFGN